MKDIAFLSTESNKGEMVMSPNAGGRQSNFRQVCVLIF